MYGVFAKQYAFLGAVLCLFYMSHHGARVNDGERRPGNLIYWKQGERGDGICVFGVGISSK